MKPRPNRTELRRSCAHALIVSSVLWKVTGIVIPSALMGFLVHFFEIALCSRCLYICFYLSVRV